MLSPLELIELWHGNGAQPCHKPQIVSGLLTVLKDPTVDSVLKQLNVAVGDDEDMRIVRYGFYMWEKAGKVRL